MSVNSMTGYGQASEQDDVAAVSVEIRTVNHRFAEVAVRTPRELLALEDEIRQRVKNKLTRGRIDVHIAIEQRGALQRLQIDWDLLGQLRSATEQLSARIPDAKAATVLDWLQFPGVLTSEHAQWPKAVSDLVMLCLDRALADVAAMRKREGMRLAADLKEKLGQVAQLVAGLRERAPTVIAGLEQRLEARLHDAVANVDDNRLATEIVILADKAAIDEEITRLSSHIEELTGTLESGEPAGRRLDFIIQEMNREVNTIASKAPDVMISKAVVDLKSVIEQMREQVQNIE